MISPNYVALKSERIDPLGPPELIALHIAARLLADALQTPLTLNVDQTAQGGSYLSLAQHPIPALRVRR